MLDAKPTELTQSLTDLGGTPRHTEGVERGIGDIASDAQHLGVAHTVCDTVQRALGPEFVDQSLDLERRYGRRRGRRLYGLTTTPHGYLPTGVDFVTLRASTSMTLTSLLTPLVV